MERENSFSDDQNRKRTRDDDEHEKNKESHKSKKLNVDEIGVFDFPWLKEGVVFKGDEYVEAEEEKRFGSSHLDQSNSNLFVFPGLDEKKVEDDDDSFWSLKVDDLEPLDCIWSCLVDQPLN